jgi:hypothetical protein
MVSAHVTYIVVRRLTTSDLGWFDEPRRKGLTASRQRAINFNKEIVSQIIPPELRQNGDVAFRALALHAGDLNNDQIRHLILSEKNWRLCGPKVEGPVFGDLSAGDYFIAQIDLDGKPPYAMRWNVLMKVVDALAHENLDHLVSGILSDSMCAGPISDAPFLEIASCYLSEPSVLPAQPKERASDKSRAFLPIPPARKPGTRRRMTVEERLRSPHVLSEMMRVASHLSAKAQMDFLNVLHSIASEFRRALSDAGQLGNVEINHAGFWPELRGNSIAFVDGGVANIEALGAAPVAIRVGSYVVTPGAPSEGRERFAMNRQLIGELYAATSSGKPIYTDWFEDPSPLRDAARFCTELSGALDVLATNPKPDWLLIHGPLVNPVSRYGVENFPDFSRDGIKVLLPKETHRTGKDANFIRVYRRQLELLCASECKICGVVERASGSHLIAETMLEVHKDWFDASFIHDARERLRPFNISDAILFEVVLEPGEYTLPISVDRNELRRAPSAWQEDIRDYPRPLVSYVNASDVALPIRVEIFDTFPPDARKVLMDLIVHSSRLLPRYVFPAGLDIVDRHVKIPDWMSRPINTRMATQLMLKAVDLANREKDTRIITAVRRMLAGTTRDWLYRPIA